MYFDDLRSYLAKVDEIGELGRISDADPDVELGALYAVDAQGTQPRVLLFENIKGYNSNFRIATNLLGSKKRAWMIRNMPTDLDRKESLREWKKRLVSRELIKPVSVGSAPVLENLEEGSEVDITKFPACRWHELDPNYYIGTSSVCLERDPDTEWVNMGSYRSQVYDTNHLGLHLAHGHHGQVIRDKWFERGLDCPVVISLGQEPSLLAAAAENTPYGVSEMDVAGWLRGEPVKYVMGRHTDLPIPASSEIAIEGFIMHPENEPMRVEGPFGEYGGYYQDMGGCISPVVKISAIWYRNNAIITGGPPFKKVDNDPFTQINRAASTLVELDSAGLHDVKGVRRIGPFTVVAVKQMYAGHARRIADFIMSGVCDRPPRILVTVDDDVDIDDDKDVFWAIESRIDPAESVHIVKDVWVAATAPRPSPEKKKVKLERGLTMASMIIDACKPFAWIDEFPPTNEVSITWKRKILEKWGNKLPADNKIAEVSKVDLKKHV